ncbi:MAG: DNA alkylation repair protein [Candidatus Marinimicrobia bacterium]|nr:DNA alkylation repair protein [Candidatus Neomarinimicrobiota bacterium]
MLLQQIRIECKKIGDPKVAVEQQRYMKSTMPYWGVKSPQLQKICRDLFKDHIPKDITEYCKTICNLFYHATHREEWYAGIQYARKFHRFIIEENVPLYIEIVNLTNWWDVVDSVAQNLIGKALLGSDNLHTLLKTWIQDDNLWIRRTSLLAQLKYKDQTDFNLLKDLVKSTWYEKEFFIRKAIGWALRQYSYTNPQAVQKFIMENENNLSPLSVQEGMKVILRPQ